MNERSSDTPVVRRAVGFVFIVLASVSLPIAAIEAGSEAFTESLNDAIVGLDGDEFSGVVFVARGDVVVFQRGYGFADKKSNQIITPDTVFDTGSVAKAMTAVAILQLADRNQLALDDNLAKFFPDIPADKRGITIHQMLTHSAGLPQYHGKGDFSKLSREKALEEIFEAELRFAPGSSYGYSNSGFTVLAAIIEDIANTTWMDYCKKNIIEPAGMRHTGFYGDPSFAEVGAAHGYVNGRDRRSPSDWRGPYWVLIGNGGLVTNAPDLLRWHRAIQDTVILSAASRDRFYAPTEVDTAPYLPGAYAGIRELTEPIRASYLGWAWSTPDGSTFCEKGGAMDYGHNAVFRYEPKSDTVSIVLANTYAQNEAEELHRYRILDSIHSLVLATGAENL